MKKAAPNEYNLPAYPDSDPRKAAEVRLAHFAFFLSFLILETSCNVLIFASQQPMDASFKINTVVFFTPEERVMQVDEAQISGYGISSTPTRLLLRSPNPSRETYTKDVSGLQFTEIQTTLT